ncbi:hypothetical protein MTP99_003434 [Tenebrio molitor]|jgi:hypothetical protein|nr:hypothetical protein MTP99_003434 [Tenebrio molitor]
MVLHAAEISSSVVNEAFSSEIWRREFVVGRVCASVMGIFDDSDAVNGLCMVGGRCSDVPDKYGGNPGIETWEMKG